ncbi:hypothetical protein O9992_23055 [Vibrio lentus]|nr:hypothetical protein [Vibrio lentus]
MRCFLPSTWDVGDKEHSHKDHFQGDGGDGTGGTGPDAEPSDGSASQLHSATAF